MAPITADQLTELQLFLKRYDGIDLYTPASPDYEEYRESFVIRPARPFAIARPSTAGDVQALIRFCLRHEVDFNIRSGGHDSAGRSQINNGLSIDMRKLNYVDVAEDKSVAKIGGGILLGQLTKLLGDEDLVTPTGAVASVGYTGWSTLGGYGPFSSLYGLGVDQIVGAKLVNARGEIVDAGEDLLTGIRGGGGIFGVIVELTVKVYPLSQAQILSSTLIYNSTDMLDTWNVFANRYNELQENEGVPDALQFQQFAMEYPGFGKVFSIGVTWADQDESEGLRWIEKVAGLGDCINISTQSVTMNQFTLNQEAVTPWPAYGRSHSISLKELTVTTLAVLANYSSLIPGGGTGLALHELRHPKPNNASVFGNRRSHHMIEILSVTTDVDYVAAGDQWALALKDDLRREDPANVLEGYIPLMDDDDTDLRLVYGDLYQTLLGLKEKYDPRNVYHYAIPRIFR